MRILVLRFSALGDVAMTVPVITSLAERYPETEITVVSRTFMWPLFSKMPSNVLFRGVDVNRYKGPAGLFRLFRRLKEDGGYDAVADLHDVLRSKILRTFFALSGAGVAHIKKGRKEKKALTRHRHKVLRQLPSSFTRYEKVFADLGFPVNTEFHSIFRNGKGDLSLFQTTAGRPDGRRWIGIAPFAAHRGKMLPETTIVSLIHELSAHENWRIFLFGGGETERRLLEHWASDHPNVQCMAGKSNLYEELALISHLDVMVSMDSANMHLASLTGIPVISIWGATHPFAGFMGWGQTADRAIQTELPCRPCSIFGNRPCFRKDYACLTGIKVKDIASKVEETLSIHA